MILATGTWNSRISGPSNPDSQLDSPVHVTWNSRSSAGLPVLRNRAQGFTLLELLVVLLIIGIILTMAVISIGDRGNDENLTEVAQRLQALVELATQEAILQSRDLGLFFDDREYTFLSYVDGKWQKLEGDDLLRPRKVPEDVELDLLVDGLSVPDQLKNKQNDQGKPGKNDKVEILPQILILSSGEVTPFTLDLRAEDSPVYYTLKGTANGKISLERLSNDR
jgi:general secretion pathway protein H